MYGLKYPGTFEFYSRLSLTPCRFANAAFEVMAIPMKDYFNATVMGDYLWAITYIIDNSRSVFEVTLSIGSVI